MSYSKKRVIFCLYLFSYIDAKFKEEKGQQLYCITFLPREKWERKWEISFFRFSHSELDCFPISLFLEPFTISFQSTAFQSNEA